MKFGKNLRPCVPNFSGPYREFILRFTSILNSNVHLLLYLVVDFVLDNLCKECKDGIRFITRQSMFVKQVPLLWAYFIEATKL